MKKNYSKTPKDSMTSFAGDDLKKSVADETKEYKELCKEIDATREMGSLDVTSTTQFDLGEAGNKNPFFDNTWGCPTIKKDILKSKDQQLKQSLYSSVATAFTDNSSLIIPSDSNYGYYPKNIGLPNEIQTKRGEMNIMIPSDSEDEQETVFLEEEEEGEREQQEIKGDKSLNKPQSPFNYSNRMRETFVNVCTPQDDSYLKSLNESNNNNNQKERKYQFRTPVNNNSHSNNMINTHHQQTTPTFQFNQTIGKYPSNNITPTAIPSSYMKSPRLYYPNAFSYNSQTQGMPTEAKFPSVKSSSTLDNQQDQKNFAINIKQILCCNNHRTTLMIKNIPVKYSSQELIAEIQQNFNRKFDLFYLPMDYKNENNLGFAFINFSDPLHIIHFLHYYKGRKWLSYKSNKECDLFYAKFQGKEELIAHLKKNSKKTGEEKKAIVFPIKMPFPRITLPNVSNNSI